MTNREAFNKYLETQLQKSLKSVNELSDAAFMTFINANPSARVGACIDSEFRWFWFTYGGQKFGYGLGKVIEWLSKGFGYDFDTEYKKWTEYDGEWTESIEEEYGMGDEHSDV